ncbi:hypothetical protein E2C01_025029 [Portunus trituberculatus]|uniref:Uncharacterized protein n=1 Tax=Portunus trituberculatus TaxID=210409 RepID=A0A5B7EC48_PORTR|nr:hypothetical protein [Portunus trituberculatus]
MGEVAGSTLRAKHEYYKVSFVSARGIITSHIFPRSSHDLQSSTYVQIRSLKYAHCSRGEVVLPGSYVETKEHKRNTEEDVEVEQFNYVSLCRNKGRKRNITCLASPVLFHLPAATTTTITTTAAATHPGHRLVYLLNL